MRKIKYTITSSLLGIGMLLSVVSCEIQDSFTYDYAPDNAKLNMSALSYIKGNDSLSLFSEAIQRTQLESMYETGTGSTFIVPNNQAFRSYFKDNGYASIGAIPVPILKNMLRYHIVKSVVNFNDPALAPSNRPIAYETENGQTMYLSHTSTYVGLINEGTNRQWQIRTSNLVPDNGVIHVVNAVVYYSAPTGDVNVNPNLVQDTIFAKQDAFVNGGTESAKNFGLDPLLKIKNVSNNGDYDRKAFLMFDFADFKKEGVVTDLKLQLAVSFTAAKGVDLNLFETPSTSWSEAALNFNNAVFPTTPRIAFIKTTKISTFRFDLTDYYKEKKPTGLKSYMLDGQPGSDETDEIASRQHPTLAPPMLIATLASGDSELTLEGQKDFEVANGGIYVLSKENLSVGGASAGDIIYTIEDLPTFGWLVKGAEVLKKGSRFTQLDLDLKNMVFIHNGQNLGVNTLKLTARDKAGAVLENIKLNVQAK
ncbi:CBM96 family carbohydrate-binding protein [Sphingobacterium sp. MYb382]|uniref:CBM96 family carbohydrate-binding protein n=1 Tax=Sphingobacterium sp. MYb382 TaxID=2745278 RepID=UPI0030B24532